MTWTPLPIVVPLFAAAVLAGAGRSLPRRVADAIAIATTIAVAALGAALVLASRAGTIVTWMGGWTPRHGIAVGVALAVDPIGAGLGTLTAVLECAAFVFTLRHFDDVHALFHALMLAFLAALVAFGETGDLFDLFVFFELMSATAYALCAYKSDQAAPLQGALSFAVVNTVAGFFVLFGLALVYGRTGALNLAHIARALGTRRDPLVVASFLLIASGFLVKAAVFPFHFWLPDAHGVAPPPVSVLFSGVMVTAGLFAVVRVWWAAFAGALGPAQATLRGVLLVLGTATALVGASMCWAQRRVKRLLAFSTVGHVGVMVLGVAALTPRGLAGAVVYATGHGLVKGALFLLAGALHHSLRSGDELKMRGRGAPGVGVVWAAAALGLAGLPPFGTFAGDEGVVRASAERGDGWVGAVTAFVEVVTAAAALRVAGRVFLGWGPGEESARKGVRADREPQGRASASSLAVASAAALVGLSVASGAVGAFGRGALAAAARMQDTAAYAARTFGDVAAAARVPVPPLAPHDVHRGIATAAAAAALAFMALFRRRAPEVVRRPVRRAMRAAYAVLRALHTGHVGDYVTWLVVGAAAIVLAGEVGMR